jgi:hypothetical protein
MLAWTMEMKNADGNGYGDFDFLIHPNAGCNFADHAFWGMHATTCVARTTTVRLDPPPPPPAPRRLSSGSRRQDAA